MTKGAPSFLAFLDRKKQNLPTEQSKQLEVFKKLEQLP